jgi:hypothetical protein
LLVLNSSVSPEYSLLERNLLFVVGSLPSLPNRSRAWDIEGKLDYALWLVLLWSSTLVVNRSVLNIGVGVTVLDTERRQESKKRRDERNRKAPHTTGRFFENPSFPFTSRTI